MKKITLITLIILALVVSGCNFPGFQDATIEESDDVMATEIAKILTGTPVEAVDTPTPEVLEVDPTDTVETVVVEEPTEVAETPEIPTDTAEAEVDTPTPTPTDTPQPTPTLSDTDPAQTLGTPDRVDDMTSSQGWPTDTDEFLSVVFEDGFMKMTSRSALSGWRVHWPSLKNFYLEATFKTPACDSSDHFGVIFRVPDESRAKKGYLFGITCDSKYNLRRWNDPVMDTLIPLTTSDKINTGENVINKLGIMARGSNLALYINGEKVNEISDSAFSSGKYGIYVGGNSVKNFTTWVDQIRYWVIP